MTRILKKYNLVILALIIVLAAFFRLYQISTNPPSLTWDEVAWGYNAYTLGIDGRDEFGRFLPHDFLESFGDFKPPVYAYLAIIPVKLFGLTEFAVRFPSALFGILTVLVTYFLVKRIFNKSENSEFYALISALFLALSPWHIMLSRAAFEANVSSFFIVTGVWLFLAAVQDKKWLIIPSAIFFALPFYTFNTGRIVVPILVLALAFVFRDKLLKIKKQTIIAFIVGILLLAPLVQFLLSPQASLRFKEVNIFSDIELIEKSNQQIANDDNASWSKVIHNRRLLYGASYVKHYLDHFSPNFLFIKGDGNPKFSTQSVGQMYIFDIIFVIGGILILFRKREDNWWIIPVWLVIAIIPAATARETPHALRIESALPTFQIIAAYGLVQFVNMYKKRKKLIVAALFLILSLNVLYFFRDYIVHYKYDYSGEWQYGYKESIAYAESVKDDYDYIKVTQSLGRPYSYYLFYTKTNPDDFRSDSLVSRDVFGFVDVESFGKYRFPKDFSYEDDEGKKVLYISTLFGLPENAQIKKTFYLLNGQPVLVAYTL